jgi:methyl-accepting chemotaxis protein
MSNQYIKEVVLGNSKTSGHGFARMNMDGNRRDDGCGGKAFLGPADVHVIKRKPDPDFSEAVLYMNHKLAIKFIAPTAALVFAAFLVTGFWASSLLERVVRNQAERAVADSLRRTVDSLAVVHELSSQQTKAASQVFLSEVKAAGGVSVSGTSTRIGEPVPDLHIGKQSVVGSFGLVDKIKDITGATATFFVKKGDGFVRVSTNVKKDDGSRAVGTPLDPNGKAIAKLRNGDEFSGVVDILGSPFMTSYVPLRSGKEVVGAVYVGYPLKSLAGLDSAIQEQKILEHGYVAVVDAKGKVRFHSSSIDDASVSKHMNGESAEKWRITKRTFDNWGYTILAAYPESDVNEAISGLKLLLIVVSLGAAIFMIAAQYWLVRSNVLKPLGTIIHRLKDVAEGEGDLTKRITLKNKDELAELAGWFNQFMERLEAIIGQLAVSTEQIASASEEISASSMQVAESAEHQKDQTQQVATAMQEMRSTVMQVTENSNHAAVSAGQAGDLARDGGRIVEETITVIRQVAENTRETAAKIEQLGKSGEQIGKIIGVIDDIADQTNLLALNAAIEAARAGDQGRGFAVVADEVRKLAERTTNATKEIAQMINAIQVETGKAVAAMEAGTVRVDAGVKAAQEAGTALRDIITSSENVQSVVTHIATAATEQTAATEHVNMNMEQIAQMVQTAAVSAQESAHACAGLSELALDLQQLVNRFKIGVRDQKHRSTEAALDRQYQLERAKHDERSRYVQ